MNRFLSIALLLSLLVAGLAVAQPQTGTITGTVMSREGQTLPGAVVVARSSVLSESKQVTAGEDGAYQLVGLPAPGDYDLTFESPGYETEKTSVSLKVGETLQHNVTLKKATAGSGPASR